MIRAVFIFCIRCYQRLISPLLPPRCRYYPSCSHYAVQALQVHGAFRGSVLAVRRILRCHPLAPGGYDPVPGTDPDVELDHPGTGHRCTDCHTDP